MLSWLKSLQVATPTANCGNCPELEARITFLEKQVDEYRRRLDEFEKLNAFIETSVAAREPDISKLFKKIGDVKDDIHEIWQHSTAVHVAFARIKEAQAGAANAITNTNS